MQHQCSLKPRDKYFSKIRYKFSSTNVGVFAVFIHIIVSKLKGSLVSMQKRKYLVSVKKAL